MDSSFSSKIKRRQLEALKKRRPDFSKFVFPLIRRLAETDLLDQLVAVQPMAMPTAEAFYMDIITTPAERRARARQREREPVLTQTPQEAAMKILCGILAKTIDRLPAVNEIEQREPKEPPTRRPQVFGLTVEAPPAHPKIASA